MKETIHKSHREESISVYVRLFSAANTLSKWTEYYPDLQLSPNEQLPAAQTPGYSPPGDRHTHAPHGTFYSDPDNAPHLIKNGIYATN